jgi:hypothetical protein
MMISKEQARAAADHLKAHPSCESATCSPQVSPELLAAAIAVIQDTPETNSQRVAIAQHHLEAAATDSHVIASMMIQRIISDSLR